MENIKSFIQGRNGRKMKTCYCIGADRCTDTSCPLVQEYRKGKKTHIKKPPYLSSKK